MTPRSCFAVLLTLGSPFAAGCTPDHDYDVRWTVLTTLPDGVELDSNAVTVPEGETVAARPSVLDEDGRELGCTIDVASDDQTVLSVERAERGAFVFSGERRGETVLTVSCGQRELDLDGRVVAAE